MLSDFAWMGSVRPGERKEYRIMKLRGRYVVKAIELVEVNANPSYVRLTLQWLAPEKSLNGYYETELQSRLIICVEEGRQVQVGQTFELALATSTSLYQPPKENDGT